MKKKNDGRAEILKLHLKPKHFADFVSAFERVYTYSISRERVRAAILDLAKVSGWMLPSKLKSMTVHPVESKECSRVFTDAQKAFEKLWSGSFGLPSDVNSALNHLQLEFVVWHNSNFMRFGVPSVYTGQGNRHSIPEIAG